MKSLENVLLLAEKVYLSELGTLKTENPQEHPS